jgi:hypothetical protein
MPHYSGKKGNSEFGQHTTAIDDTEEMIEILTQMPWQNRIKLGIIVGRRPKKPFFNCTITDTSLIFKLGGSSVQTIAVTFNGCTPVEFFEEFEKRYTKPIRLRNTTES